MKLPNTMIVNGIVVELKDPSECQTTELGKKIFTKKSTWLNRFSVLNRYNRYKVLVSAREKSWLRLKYFIMCSVSVIVILTISSYIISQQMVLYYLEKMTIIIVLKIMIIVNKKIISLILQIIIYLKILFL